MLKVGVVGVGGISGAHIPAWNKMEETELVALCDIRPEQMEKYSDVNKYTDFDQMLENEELDILDICLPTYLHADFAIKAMKKGINVVCEKPVSLKNEDVERVYTTAKENNVKFMVAQVLRFWPDYEVLKEIYDKKKYGKLISGVMQRIGVRPKWSWDNWMADEERSGLVPYDLHIHDLDFMVYAFGSPKNMRYNRAKRPEQDYLSMVYTYDDFFITAEAAWYDAPYPFTASFRFQFEKALVTNVGGKFMVYESDGEIIDLTVAEKGDTGDINLPKSDGYFNELRYFTDCVINNEFPEKVKPEELEEVIRILNSFNS